MGKTITVIIREIREKHIVVDTNDPQDALDTVEYMYSEGNFPLSKDDVEDVEFEIIEE